MPSCPPSYHIATSQAATDHLYAKDNRPPIARDIAIVTNTLSEMLEREGLGHKVSDCGPLLNDATGSAWALRTRLNEKIASDANRLDRNRGDLSFALLNRAAVRGKKGHFILQKNNVLAARPHKITHWRKIVTSSTYRYNINNTRAHFGTTNSPQIKETLDKDIKRLTEESHDLLTNISLATNFHTEVCGLLKDLIKIEQQRSQMKLSSISAETLNYRAST